MRQFFQAVWWWIRVAIIVVVGIYVLTLFWNNAAQHITLWYWPGRTMEQSAVALALASFILGGIVCTMGWALLSATIRFRRSRAERKRRLIEEQRETINRKAAMLRVKPVPQPIVREPKRVVEQRRLETSIPVEPKPIEVEVAPPRPAESSKPTFSTGAIPVEVDQVIVLAPPPKEADDLPREAVIEVVDDPDRPKKAE